MYLAFSNEQNFKQKKNQLKNQQKYIRTNSLKLPFIERKKHEILDAIIKITNFKCIFYLKCFLSVKMRQFFI